MKVFNTNVHVETTKTNTQQDKTEQDTAVIDIEMMRRAITLLKAEQVQHILYI